MSELQKRIERIYASIGATFDRKPGLIDAQIIRKGRSHTMFWHAGDGRSDAKLENDLQTVVQNVASLRDHLIHWAKARGIGKEKIFDALRASRPLQIITDLWNIDKHKELDRAPWSKTIPRLANIHPTGKITCEAGQSVYHAWDPATGKHMTNAPNSMARVIDADVVDEHGKRLGGFQELVERAVDDWEKCLFRLR